MKWFIAAALVIGVLALVFMAPGSKRTSTDVDAMMKRVRAAKARKAKERKEKITYTPPAKNEGGIMKVA